MANPIVTIPISMRCYPPGADPQKATVFAYSQVPGSSSITLQDCPLAGFILEEDGEIKYMPCSNFSGEDSFSFIVDGDPAHEIREVKISVTPSNCGYQEVTRCKDQPLGVRTWASLASIGSNRFFSVNNICFKVVGCPNTCPEVGAELIFGPVVPMPSCADPCPPLCCNPSSYHYSVGKAHAKISWSFSSISDIVHGVTAFDPISDKPMFFQTLDCPMTSCSNSPGGVVFSGGASTTPDPSNRTGSIYSLTGVSGTFQVGEVVKRSGSPIGRVFSFAGSALDILNGPPIGSGTLVGQDSGATGNISSVQPYSYNYTKLKVPSGTPSFVQSIFGIPTTCFLSLKLAYAFNGAFGYSWSLAIEFFGIIRSDVTPYNRFDTIVKPSSAYGYSYSTTLLFPCYTLGWDGYAMPIGFINNVGSCILMFGGFGYGLNSRLNISVLDNPCQFDH